MTKDLWITLEGGVWGMHLSETDTVKCSFFVKALFRMNRYKDKKILHLEDSL